MGHGDKCVVTKELQSIPCNRAMDSGLLIPLEIPDVFIEEMLCDWLGAGKAINGSYDFNFKWYFIINYTNVVVSESTRIKIDSTIKKINGKHFLRK
jgi:hypothetical protein